MMHAYHLGPRRLEAGGSGVHSRAELPVSSVLACATDARNQYPKSKQRKEPPQRESYNVEMALWVSICSTSSEDLSLYLHHHLKLGVAKACLWGADRLGEGWSLLCSSPVLMQTSRFSEKSCRKRIR